MSWAQRWVRATASPKLLVVGGASLDTIHVDGVPVATPGGAGLYTALAAARAGAQVTMLAPRPDPMPAELAPALDRITWIGPTVGLDGLPRFEIAYDDEGAVTLFREHLGAEPDMTPALLDEIDDMPSCAYCVPFMDARLQRRFVDALRARGCLTVAATYGRAARLETELVRDTLDLADLSFCNADEESLLYAGDAAPPTGHLRFVTRGRAGVSVHQGAPHRRARSAGGRGRPDRGGRHVLRHHDRSDPGRRPPGGGRTKGQRSRRRDGDGSRPDRAVAARPAAGASTLPAGDRRRRGGRSSRCAHRRCRRSGGVGVRRPAVPAGRRPGRRRLVRSGHPPAVRLLVRRDGGWDRSMIASIDGTRRKGSDYLWASYRRWAANEPGAMTPGGRPP
ncbi:MAG: hypothetical protein R2697_19115 [Ilumatobacteraceae bacterium]